MNVLIATIANPYGNGQVGGAEMSCRLLAKKLASHGHRVLYLTVNADAAARQTASRDGVRLSSLPDITVKHFRLLDRVTEARWHLVLAYWCWRYQVAVIYCFYELAVVKAALWLRSRLGYPRVIMRMAGLHWYIASQRQPELIPQYEGVFRSVDSLNFLTKGLFEITKTNMRELNFKSEFRHSRVLDIGTDVVEGTNRNRFKTRSGPFNIVMATRFSDYQKRQDILIQAMACLPSEHHVHLTLVGEGPTLESIRNLAKESGVSDHLTFLPFMEQADLMELLDHQYLLCHACDFEGLGKIIVEAMARGLPVLVSDVAPLNSYIHDGENGFLVPNTPQAWADYIVKLSLNRDLLSRVSAMALKFARAQWSADQNVIEYQEYFKEVASCK